MSLYRDSVGNTYNSVTTGLKKGEAHTAKATKHSREGRKGRNKKKCERYRAKVGRPNGPGRAGNKSGKNKITR